jgi:hypothetical protein
MGDAMAHWATVVGPRFGIIGSAVSHREPRNCELAGSSQKYSKMLSCIHGKNRRAKAMKATTFTTTQELRKLVKYISVCLNIPSNKVVEKAVKEMQARYGLPDPPTLGMGHNDGA